MNTPKPPHPQGTPGLVDDDFVGCSHDALVALIDTVPADDLKRSLIGAIEKHGATHNQRSLIQAAYSEWTGEPW